MAISTNDLKNGMALDLPDGLYAVVEFQHVKPGKGGAFVRTKLRNMRTKAVLERTFRADERVEQAVIDKREMQYLYRDGADFVLMDNVSFDQMTVPESSVGEAANFLKAGDSVVVVLYGTEIVDIELPAAVELEVTETEPGMQGDRVSGARKPATTETGLVVQVPLFISIGERIKVDTRSGEYLTPRVGDRNPPPASGTPPRERALDLLYESEAKDTTPSEVLAALPVEPDPFAEELVRGVEGDLETIDALIAKHAEGWAVDRMPAVDRQLMRIATYELIARLDVSRAVVIDEAVDLAKDFSTAESGAYVNGVLSAIADELGR